MVKPINEPLRRRLVDVLKEGPKDREEICEAIGLTSMLPAYGTIKPLHAGRSTIYNNLDALILMKLVAKRKGPKAKRRGPRKTVYFLSIYYVMNKETLELIP